MIQKDIYWADLNPKKGSEQGGKRPVLVISGNTMNKNLGIVVICPISTKIKKYAGCVQINKNKVNNLSNNSEVITFQIRAISKDRLSEKIGKITDLEMKKVFAELNDILTF